MALMDSSAPPTQEEPVELSVIVPCLNEELNLPELTARVLRTFDVGGFVGEIVLVDDGSTDGTARGDPRALRPRTAARSPASSTRRTAASPRAWKSGARAARGKLVATIDADLQYQPEDLLRLRRELYEHSRRRGAGLAQRRGPGEGAALPPQPRA